jgi:hypothetical protein
MKLTTKNKMVDLLEKSVIVQGIMTLAVVGVSLYLFAIGREVPSTLIQWAGFMMGLYGAGKVHSLTKGSD